MRRERLNTSLLFSELKENCLRGNAAASRGALVHAGDGGGLRAIAVQYKKKDCSFG